MVRCYALVILATMMRVAFTRAQATLEPFTAIVVRGNHDVVIQPCSDSSYTYQILDGPVEAEVQDGTLYIDTTRAIGRGTGTLLVSIPSTSLSSLTIEGNGDVAALSGFEAEDFSVTASGNGDTKVQVDVRGPLTLNKSGRGTLIVTGSSESLNLEKSGNGEVIVSGVQGDASVSIDGRGETVIAGGPNLKISGSAGTSPILYSGGSCSIAQCVRTPSIPSVDLPFLNGPIISGRLGNCLDKGSQTSVVTTSAPAPAIAGARPAASSDSGPILGQIGDKLIASECGPGASMLSNDVCYGACDGYQTMSGDVCTCDGEPCRTWMAKGADSEDSEDVTGDLETDCGPNAGGQYENICFAKCTGTFIKINGDCTCNGDPCVSWKVGETGPSTSAPTPGIKVATAESPAPASAAVGRGIMACASAILIMCFSL